MPCDKRQENENNNNDPGADAPSFITKYQFAAIVKHFEKILEELKLDEEQYKIRLELRNLLDFFKSSYAESERKTNKIFELKATNAIELLRIKSLNSEQDEAVEGLRGTIKVLQRDLDAVNKQRKELFEELEGLRKGVETADKAIETDSAASERPRTPTRKKDFKIFQSLVSGVMKAKKTDEKQPTDDQLPVQESMETLPKEVTDVKLLKNDLDILVADLKMTRKKVIEVKKEIRQRDAAIKKYAEDLAFSEEMLEESRKQVVEVRKPLEKSMKKCQAEVERIKQKYENVYKELQAAFDVNTKLSKDVESKELVIENLKAKLEVLHLERDANEKKANIYEEHLARSQGKIKLLEQEIESLKHEVEGKKKEIIALEKIGGTIQEKDKIDVSAQERFVEKLKNQIMLREKKLLGVGNELQATVEVLQSVKRDQDEFKKNKACLEHEVENLKEILKGRNEDLKQGKEKLKSNEKEMNNLKKELYSWVKKYQQLTEKKNKFHDLYNNSKIQNKELGKENMILVKRQQYLLKILKEKDKEIEKLLHWKEYNI